MQKSYFRIYREKKKELLDKWWTLEHHVLESYEKIGDFLSAAKTCNNLIEFWQYDFLWLQRDHSKIQKQFEELRNLAEKAIKILSKMDKLLDLHETYHYYL